MTIYDYHRVKMARHALHTDCTRAFVLTGMDHIDASRLLNQKPPVGCTCLKARLHIRAPKGWDKIEAGVI